ncbi:potassium/ion channel protein [Planococcus antarcticus DSM 14505]|uniref:Potassium/ion channel protein n=1 Tax=Planococcus antarcticus DSM 14505 TaxID=1185653 RepID=A0AA87LSY7_9BACL|nr:ion channel [Planococcus antarcticus]EIM06674.1 potassium/ion channel protein [Planococcus antarcticus DSM 14505]
MGYGDISPTTLLGRILAVLLLIIGIGIIVTFTSLISSYFTSNKEPIHEELVISVVKNINKMDEFFSADEEVILNYLKRKTD